MKPDNFNLTSAIVNSRNREKGVTMTEMKNSVRQRANGTWEGRYYGADGKQHSVYGSTKNAVFFIFKLQVCKSCSSPVQGSYRNPGI